VIQWLKQEIRSHEDIEIKIEFLASMLVFVNDPQARRFLNNALWVYCEADRRRVCLENAVGSAGKRKRKSKVQTKASSDGVDNRGGEW
jgi:hypothetical protein